VARLRRSALVGVLLGASVALAGCGTGGAVAQARASCVHVTRALALHHQAQHAGLATPAGTRLENRALAELLRGTPAAAAATSIDGSWNPLMTTINEAERVPLANLVPALRRLCQVAQSSTPYL
jgi:hypothetical protein